MRIIRTVYLLGFVLIFLIMPSFSKAQGICVIPTLKVPSVKGKVLSRQEGVPQVTIELRDWRDQTKTLATILTDEEGNFDLKDVKKGRYLLVVSRKLFSSLHIPIRVEPKRKSKGRKLLIHLAIDTMDPCSEGGVEFKRLVTDTSEKQKG